MKRLRLDFQQKQGIDCLGWEVLKSHLTTWKRTGCWHKGEGQAGLTCRGRRRGAINVKITSIHCLDQNPRHPKTWQCQTSWLDFNCDFSVLDDLGFCNTTVRGDRVLLHLRVRGDVQLAVKGAACGARQGGDDRLPFRPKHRVDQGPTWSLWPTWQRLACSQLPNYTRNVSKHSSPILWKVLHSASGILVGKLIPSPRAVFTGKNHNQALGPITFGKLCLNES